VDYHWGMAKRKKSVQIRVKWEDYAILKQEADRKDTDIGVIVHNLIMGEIPHHD